MNGNWEESMLSNVLQCSGQTKKLLRSILDQISDAVFVKDRQGYYLFVNKAAAHTAGKLPEEMIGCKDTDLYPAEIMDEAARADQWVMDHNQPFVNETMMYVNGEMHTFEERKFPYCNENGEIMGVISVARDITRHNQVKEALYEAQNMLEVQIKERTYQLEQTISLLQATFEATADGIVALDHEKRQIITCNQNFVKLFKIPEAIIDSGDLNDLLEHVSKQVKDGDGFLRKVKEMYENAEHEVADVMEFKDGRVFERYIKPRRIGDRVVGRVLGFQDITERKIAEEKLRESEKLYRMLFHNANDSLYVYKINNDGMPGHFIEVNEMACKTLGYTKEEFFYLTPMDLMDAPLMTIEEIIKKLVKEYHTVFETMHVTKSGTKIPVEISSHLFDLNGEPAAVSIVRDITQRKKLEEEHLKTSKLESLGVLAGGIAHDFNNILTAVLGNITLAKMKLSQESEEKVYERLTRMEKAALQAQNLTHQLLTFAKGGEPIKKTQSIKQFIKEEIELILSGSNVQCEFFLAHDLALVEIDKGQFTQVLDNLIINAMQAMPEGGIIQISAENIIIDKQQTTPFKHLVPGKYVKISVKDEGMGIEEEYLQRIFDPYFTTKKKGNGLGLAAVYSIISKHGGYITVESKVGMGTTFHIYLPVSEKKRTYDRNKPVFFLQGKGNILIMDDEERIREIAGEILMHLGYQVAFAKDGLEAIAVYEKADPPFDAVIMDLTIPGGMGGKETIHKLRAIDPHVKAIVSSGYSNDPIMAKFKDYGFVQFIEKPYTIEKLSQVLHRVISDN